MMDLLQCQRCQDDSMPAELARIRKFILQTSIYRQPWS